MSISSYDNVIISLNKGDYLILDFVFEIGEKKRSLMLSFRLEGNSIETTLKSLGESIVEEILQERLLPILHSSVYFLKMFIHLKKSAGPENIKSYLFLLPRTVAGYVKEGEIIENMPAIFEIQKMDSMSTFYRTLYGVPSYKLSNGSFSTVENCQAKINVVENLFAGLFYLNLGKTAELQAVFLSDSNDLKTTKISPVVLCFFRGVKKLNTRGKQKGKESESSSDSIKSKKAAQKKNNKK